MLFPVIFFLLLLALTVFLLNLKVHILIEYVRKKSDDNIVVSFYSLGGLVKYKYEIKQVNFNMEGIRSRLFRKKGRKESITSDEEKHLSLEEIRNHIHYWGDLYRAKKEIFDYTMDKAVLGEFILDVLYGTGDAFFTGISGGVLWSFAGMLTAFLENRFRVGKRRVNIVTDFNEKVFDIDLYCIFSLKIAHIIVIILKSLFDYLRRKISKHRNEPVKIR